MPAEVESARLVESRGSPVSPQTPAEPEAQMGYQVTTEPECLSQHWDLAGCQAGQRVSFETVSKSEKMGHKHTDPPKGLIALPLQSSGSRRKKKKIIKKKKTSLK